MLIWSFQVKRWVCSGYHIKYHNRTTRSLEGMGESCHGQQSRLTGGDQTATPFRCQPMSAVSACISVLCTSLWVYCRHQAHKHVIGGFQVWVGV